MLGHTCEACLRAHYAPTPSRTNPPLLHLGDADPQSLELSCSPNPSEAGAAVACRMGVKDSRGNCVAGLPPSEFSVQLIEPWMGGDPSWTRCAPCWSHALTSPLRVCSSHPLLTPPYSQLLRRLLVTAQHDDCASEPLCERDVVILTRCHLILFRALTPVVWPRCLEQYSRRER